MHRRSVLKAGVGLVTLPFMSRLAFAADQKPITFWYEAASPENQEALQNLLVAPFNASNPDELLSIDVRGSDLDKQLRIAMLSGTGPDVVFTAGPSYVASMAQAGQLLPLDDYARSSAGATEFSRCSWSSANIMASFTRSPRPMKPRAYSITRRSLRLTNGTRRPPSPSSSACRRNESQGARAVCCRQCRLAARK